MMMMFAVHMVDDTFAGVAVLVMRFAGVLVVVQRFADVRMLMRTDSVMVVLVVGAEMVFVVVFGVTLVAVHVVDLSVVMVSVYHLARMHHRQHLVMVVVRLGFFLVLVRKLGHENDDFVVSARKSEFATRKIL